MKVLIVGSGAREHALGWKIKQSKDVDALFFAPGNCGTAELGQNVPIEPEEISRLVDWASGNGIGLTVVGPEVSLMAGIQEAFSERKLLLFGPSRKAALLEGSKIWAKDFLLRNRIPTAISRSFSSYKVAREYIKRHPYPLVIKADGLAQGKGVLVCEEPEEAERCLSAFMRERILGSSGERVVVEEYVEGEEISTFALSDGNRLVMLGEARDYKRAYDENLGPNTGGMGGISHPDLVDGKTQAAIREEVFTPTLEGLKREGILYRGILYAGLKLAPTGPKVLEFNVRFGDPEAQILLPRLEGDLVALLLACARGELKEESIALSREATVGVVVAANGYPGRVDKGLALPLLDPSDDILLFQASTRRQEDQVVNGSGRTLTVVGRSASLEEARRKVYQYLDAHPFQGFFYRKDIGGQSLSLVV